MRFECGMGYLRIDWAIASFCFEALGEPHKALTYILYGKLKRCLGKSFLGAFPSVRKIVRDWNSL